MKQIVTVCLVATLAVPSSHGGPAETAILAAMHLSDQPNYSWTATVADDARTYDIHGKTERGAYTRVKMPVINSVRRRLGRSVTDTDVNLIFRGNVACVIETEKGWRRPEELPAESDDEDMMIPTPIGGSTIVGSRTAPAGIMKGAIIRPTKKAPHPREVDERAYSNLQLAISHPHEELAVIVSSHVDFKVEGDVVSGSLTNLGAQLLLVRDGQKTITPLRATGTFKLWLRDRTVAKYQVKLDGVLSVDTPNGRRQIEVHQTTETVVKDVGATRFDVPDIARVKLAR